jgi:hypothetical protein
MVDYVATFLYVIHVRTVSPFSVTFEHVPDRDLGALLARLSEAGFESPIIRYVGADGPSDGAHAPARPTSPDLPEEWRLLREREGESYRWPKRRDEYSPYRVFMGTTRGEGAVQIGLGETIRENAWGRERKYVVAFLSGGSPQHPLVEFVAADDFEDTRELVAVIRGSDGGRRMYGVADKLPAVYVEHFRTAIYNERVVHPRAWNKVVVVAREDDDASILNHALIQTRRRYRT